jgi:hypothetical protein
MCELSRRRGLPAPGKLITIFEAENQYDNCDTFKMQINIRSKEYNRGVEKEKEKDYTIHLTDSELLEPKEVRLERHKAIFNCKAYEAYRRCRINNEEEEQPSDKLFHKLFADTLSEPTDMARAGELRVGAFWGGVRKALSIDDEEIGYVNYAGDLGGDIYEDDEEIVEVVRPFHHGNKRFTRWTKPLEVVENQSGYGMSRKLWN